MDNKNIWIINENLTTPDLADNGHSRHYFLSKEFEREGYSVMLITSSFSHNPYREVKFRGLYKLYSKGIKTLVVKGITYKKSSSKWRIFNWFIFSFLLYFIPFFKFESPSIIILSSTSMVPVYNVLFFKLLFPKTKFIFETRDLWPLTPMEIGGYTEKSLFIKILAHLEKISYQKADFIVSVLKNSDKHIRELLDNKSFNFEWISNGVDMDSLEKLSLPVAESTTKWKSLRKIKEEDFSFVIGYAGTLGTANAIDTIIDTFNRYFCNSNCYLAIVGEGGEKNNLKKLAKENPNIIFYDSVSKLELVSFYELCDFLYLGWLDRKLYKYGISANKLFEYMYFKTPIIMSGNIEDNIIEESDCGVIAKAEDIDDIKLKIDYLISCDPERLKEMGENGFNHISQFYSYKFLSAKYIKVFNKLL